MPTKDLILIAISGCALALSLLSLIVTLIQKNRETKRNIKKTLADALENITKIGVESAKLVSASDSGSPNNIEIRRSYNFQRRVQLAHADFLVEKYDKLATEIDCAVLADGYSRIGEHEKAQCYWRKTIEKSKTPTIRCINCRGYGFYLFRNGDVDEGRKMFSEAISSLLNDFQVNKSELTDTYLILGNLELEYGTKEHVDRCLTESMEACYNISNRSRQNELRLRIQELLDRRKKVSSI